MELKDLEKLDFVFQVPRHKNRKHNVEILDAMEEILTAVVKDNNDNAPFTIKMGLPLANIINKKLYEGNSVFSPALVYAIMQIMADNLKFDDNKFELNLLIESVYVFGHMFDDIAKELKNNKQLKDEITKLCDNIVQLLNANKAMMEEKNLSVADLFPSTVKHYFETAFKNQIELKLTEQSYYLIAAAILDSHNFSIPDENKIDVWVIGSILYVWASFINLFGKRLHTFKFNINGYEYGDVADETITNDGNTTHINLGDKIKK